MWWFVLPAQALDRVVPDDYETVHQALADADDGDTIVVRKGRHVGGSLWGAGRTLTIRGEPGAVLIDDGSKRSSVLNVGATNVFRVEDLVIDGEGSLRALGLFDDAEVTLVRVTLRNGSGSSGGAFASNQSSLVVEDSVFEGNTGFGSGGGVRITDSASLLLTSSELAGNAATSGGGLWCGNDATCTVSGTMVRDNTASQGAGIAVEGAARLVLLDTTLCRNEASLGGGLHGQGGLSRITAERSVFLANVAQQGGAVYAYTEASFLDGTWVGNEADSSVVTAGPSVAFGHAVVVGNEVAFGVLMSGVGTWLGPVLYHDNTGQTELQIDDVTADPLFVEEPSGDCDWDPRVLADSPAVTYGDPLVDGVLGAGDVYDRDGDGYADDDCDDDDPQRNPGAIEVCNGLDDDCDELVDDDDGSLEATTYYTDLDGDGVGAGQGVVTCVPGDSVSQQDGDCDDADPEVRPGVPERCATPYDDDCDGLQGVDAVDMVSVLVDDDGDGFGGEVSVVACPPERATVPGDCDDADPAAHPGADEICGDGRDQDCDGLDLACSTTGGGSSTDGAEEGELDSTGLSSACGCASSAGGGPGLLGALFGAWTLRRRRSYGRRSPV